MSHVTTSVTKIILAIYLVALAWKIDRRQVCLILVWKCWGLLNQDCIEKWELRLADLYFRGDDCGDKETVIIELQGDLQSRLEGGGFDGKFIGNLVFTSDVSFLIIFFRGDSILTHFTNFASLYVKLQLHHIIVKWKPPITEMVTDVLL